jgi:hypothetical protein
MYIPMLSSDVISTSVVVLNYISPMQTYQGEQALHSANAVLGFYRLTGRKSQHDANWMWLKEPRAGTDAVIGTTSARVGN